MFFSHCDHLSLSVCCRQDTLKRRLTRDFPQLVFHPPRQHNMCEMVFVETLSADTLLDRLPEFEVSHNHTDSQSDSEPITAGLQRPTTEQNTRTLYNAAMILKGLICDSPGMKCPWPPTSDDLKCKWSKACCAT